MSYCYQPMYVVRGQSCVLHRQQLLQTTPPLKPLGLGLLICSMRSFSMPSGPLPSLFELTGPGVQNALRQDDLGSKMKYT